MRKASKKKMQEAFNKLIKKVKTNGKYKIENNFDYDLSIYRTYRNMVGSIWINEFTCEPQISFFQKTPLGSLFREAIKDKRFVKRKEKMTSKRAKEQPKCLKCKEEWSKEEKVFPLLHHTKAEGKRELVKKKIEKKIYNPVLRGHLTIEEGYFKFNPLIKKLNRGLLSYYKTLKDTQLICRDCHLKIHGII